jgi:hypothetical protein
MGVYPYAWLRRPNKEYWSEMKEDLAFEIKFSILPKLFKRTFVNIKKTTIKDS